jgi:multisubunit Na+/H+ antiporter MnhB subunit
LIYHKIIKQTGEKVFFLSSGIHLAFFLTIINLNYKQMKKFFKSLGLLILTLVILFVIFLVYSTLADYKPEPIEPIAKSDGAVVNV